MVFYSGLQISSLKIDAQPSNHLEVTSGDCLNHLPSSVSLNQKQNSNKNLVATIMDNVTNMHCNNTRFVTESLDKFGIKKVYPTELGGREWYVNMDNPYNDNNFILGNIDLEKQPDGSWQVGSDDITDTFNGKFHIILGVNTPPDQKQWKNVEITGYAKVISTADPNYYRLQWYARGGSHTSETPCEGTALKGQLLVNGVAGWVKEIWHDGGYTYQNGTNSRATNSILDRWIGFKVVMYNINNDTAVKMESYIDNENNNNWTKVTDFIDNGTWYSGSTDDVFYSANCGKPKNYVITNSGPIASFRSDGIVWNFKNLSVREIQPPSFADTID